MYVYKICSLWCFAEEEKTSEYGLFNVFVETVHHKHLCNQSEAHLTDLILHQLCSVAGYHCWRFGVVRAAA